MLQTLLAFPARFCFSSLGRGSGACPSRALLLLLWLLRTADKALNLHRLVLFGLGLVIKRNMSQKILRRRQKEKRFEEKNMNGRNNRFLISINVLGSAGPIRFVVNEGDVIAAVIDTALKSYARQGRLPRLGSDINHFLLYCANVGADALSPWELIGSCGGRNFVLCKKQIEEPQLREARPEILAHKGSGSWKTWLNKSFNCKILSH